MEKTVLCLALIIIPTYIVHGAEERSSVCDDDSWIAYNDEKCFKLFQTFATRHQAEDVCNQQPGIVSVPTLAIIRSADEQQFLVEYIYNASDSNNVWIGAERRLGSSSKFDWHDGTPVEIYTNWQVGSPTEDVRRSCVLMRSEVSRTFVDMQWNDIACTGGNWFICQKLQSWSMEYFHQALLAIRRDLIDVKNQLHDLRDNQFELRDNQMALVYNFTRQMVAVNSQLKDVRDSQLDMQENQKELVESFTSQMTEMRNQLGDLRDNEMVDVKNQLKDLRANQAALTESFTNKMTDVNSQLEHLRANQSELRENQIDLVEIFTDQMTDITNQLGDLRDTQMVDVRNQLVDLRDNQRAVADNFTSQMTNTSSQINVLQDNPVPVDFIYVQLHNQPNPSALWPRVQWQDITVEYAGLFFRAQGTNSSAFGVIQEQSSASLRIQTVQSELWNGGFVMNPNNEFGKGIVTGSVNPATWGMRFALTAAEVRPRNAAVRIWKRIG